MNEAQQFTQAHGTDPADLMTALDAAGIESNQDWENESTAWTFPDGSVITVSGMDVEVTEPSAAE